MPYDEGMDGQRLLPSLDGSMNRTASPPPNTTSGPLPLELELPLLPLPTGSLPQEGETPGIVVVDLGDTGGWIVP